MSTFAQPQPIAASSRSRSLGTKFFLVLLLASVMSLSGFFVEGLTSERAAEHGVAAAVDTGKAQEQPKEVLGIQLVDSYQSTRRSLHYIPLFLGLVFLTYFLFEVSTGKSLHPAQYVLVGVAQTIFYLLLLSLGERLSFDKSFVIAGASTVVLFSVNIEWLFRSRALALRALGIFSLLYGFIYILLRVQAYALLVGAVTSFVAVATAMYVTREVDWYGLGSSLRTPPPPVPVASGHDSWLD